MNDSTNSTEQTKEPLSAPSGFNDGLEMPRQPTQQIPQELQDAFARMASAAEKPKAPDEMVWVNIYCAVANCFNSERSAAVAWADEGLREFRKRFRM